MSTQDPIERLHEAEQQSPVSPQELSRDTLAWLATIDDDAPHLLRVERLRREHADVWREIVVSCDDQTRRGVLAAIVSEGGQTTYSTIQDYVSCTRRTVRTHVHDLQDADVLDVGDGRPAAITFASEVVEALASDALSKFVT